MYWSKFFSCLSIAMKQKAFLNFIGLQFRIMLCLLMFMFLTYPKFAVFPLMLILQVFRFHTCGLWYQFVGFSYFKWSLFILPVNWHNKIKTSFDVYFRYYFSVIICMVVSNICSISVIIVPCFFPLYVFHTLFIYLTI